MASPLQPEKSKRLVKFPFPFQGLNSTAPSLVLSKGFCPKVDLIRFAQGEISSQPALVTRAATGFVTPVSGAFTQTRDDGTVLIIVATQDTFLTYDFTANVWTAYPFTVPLANTGTEEDFWSFADVFGEIFASNGVGSLVWTADGGTFTELNTGASPLGYSGRYLASFAGRLILANTREGPVQHEERVRWSVAQSPRDFTSDSSAGANDIVDLPGPITGIITMGGRLFIHKRAGITVMIETGLRTPSFAFQTVVDGAGTGTVAGRTLLNIRGMQFFLGAADIYAYDGASTPLAIGEPVRKELFAAINWAKVGNSWANHYEDQHEYQLFVPTGSNQWPTASYIFNYTDRTWTKRTIPSNTIGGNPSIGGTAGALVQVAPDNDIWDGVDNTWDTGNDNPKDLWDAPSEVPHLVPFIAQSLGSIIYADETATALGQTASLETADYDLDKPGDLKTVDRIRVTIRQRNDTTLSLSLSVDGGATFTTPVTASLGAPVGDETSIRTLFFPVTRTTGEYFRLRLTSTLRFSLVSWELEVIDRAEVR